MSFTIQNSNKALLSRIFYTLPPQAAAPQFPLNQKYRLIEINGKKEFEGKKITDYRYWTKNGDDYAYTLTAERFYPSFPGENAGKNFRFSGFGQCNQWSAPAEFQEGQKLATRDVKRTASWCKGLEDEFFKGLDAVEKWEVEKGSGNLILEGKNNDGKSFRLVLAPVQGLPSASI